MNQEGDKHEIAQNNSRGNCVMLFRRGPTVRDFDLRGRRPSHIRRPGGSVIVFWRPEMKTGFVLPLRLLGAAGLNAIALAQSPGTFSTIGSPLESLQPATRAFRERCWKSTVPA